MATARRSIRHTAVLTLLILVSPFAARAQSGAGATGSVTGRVTDAGQRALDGATVRLLGTRLAARTGDDGSFRIDGVPAGSYRARVAFLGFAPDTADVTVPGAGGADLTIRLRPAAIDLQSVLVTANRLGETRVAALDRQQTADNLVNVLAGDEIRALPNGNAAEAAGRMPSVALERDEGEGKFVQIRGTEPRLSNVTVDGSHIPGTERARIVKLDDVPSDLLGAIEVSKTLRADMDADAIGGSVNLVTKTPEGPPRGYLAGQFGHIALLNHTVGQGSLTYGGRFGQDAKLGVLLGASVDRNNRVINDVEPAWSVDGAGRSTPVEWSERDYAYYRSRFGIGGDVDYRLGPNSTLYVKGLWSLFKNHGTRYVYDVATSGDSAGSGATGFGTGTALSREVSQRTPTEQLWGLTAGGRHDRGGWAVDYALNLSGTRQSVTDYRSSPFVYSGATGLTVKYDASNLAVPTYRFATPAQATAAADPANFLLGGYGTSDGLTTGRDIGGAFNARLAYQVGDRPGGGALKIGLRVRDETKDYTQRRRSLQATGSYSLAQALTAFADPQFYSAITRAFPLGPLPDDGLTHSWEEGNPGAFADQTDTVGNALGSFRGSERVYAGYVMNSLDLGALHVNLGLRLELTRADYTGHVAATPTDTAGNPTGPTTVAAVRGTQQYTDLFPSVQLRYAVAENTSVRAAVTRGIARPNYSDLAPSLQGNLGTIYQHQYGNLSAGNPSLRPQHAWNYDLLVEHFLPSLGGMISGGAFYKHLTDFILSKQFIYTGPYAPFDGYYGTEPANGGAGHVAGVEVEWIQHFAFLPGALAGLGVDLNWTHTSSQALVDTATGRQAPLLRQAPDIANATLTYDRGVVSARVAWTYNGANIASYGDGSATANGDNYFYAHSQIDASAILTLQPRVQLQLQALNLNNAVFGFFNGTPDHAYSLQREYYGQTFYFGVKYGF